MRLIILFLITISLFSCTKHAKIGISVTLSGNNSPLGLDIRDGALLGFEDLKDISKIKYDVFVVDDKNSETEVTEIDTKLINSGVDIVLGHGTSSMTKAVLPLYNTKKRVLISATADSDYFLGKDDYLYRLVGSSTEESMAIANYIVDNDIGSNIICILDSSNTLYVNGWYSQFNETLQINNHLVPHVIHYDSSVIDMLYNKVEENSEALKNADVIVFVTNSVDLALWSLQIDLLDAEPLKFSSGWAKNNDILSSNEPSVNGIIFSEMFEQESQNPRYLRFRKNFKKSYNREPSSAAVQAYEAVLLINRTFENKSSSQNLKQSISSIKEMDGLQGYIKFTPFGDAIREPFFIQIKDGKFTPIISQ